jgi:hypothetical protein
MHNSRRNSTLPVILALAMASSSCLFQKKRVAFIPPPVRAAAKPVNQASALPDPPLIAGNPAENIPQAPASLPDVPPPPAPRSPPRRPPVATTPPKPTVTQTQPEAPAPRLGQLFTPDQQREYNRSLDESLERVKRALSIVSGKSLNAEQSEIANKIRTFQKQAEEARDQDLLTAVTLAKRADVLAQDLLQRLP